MNLFALIMTIVSMFFGPGQLVGTIPNPDGGAATVVLGRSCIEINYNSMDAGLQQQQLCQHSVDDINKIEVVGAGDYLYVTVEDSAGVWGHILHNPDGFNSFNYQPASIIYVPSVFK